MIDSRLSLVVLVTTALSIHPAVVSAQDADSTSDEPTPWTGSLSLAANANFLSNENVVGQVDGYAALLGLGSSGTANYKRDSHEVTITGSLNESFSRTPTLEQFIKNNDSLAASGVYNYYFLDWSGGYGRAGVDTSIFENYNVTATPTTYTLDLADGGERTISEVERLKIADPFKPTTLNQSVGGFVEPETPDQFQPRARLGLAARETFGRNVFVIDDDEETPDVVEAREVDDIYQGGVEAFAGATGAFTEQRLSYEVGLTGFLPILNNDSQNRSAVELFRLGFTGALTYNAFDWLSANYMASITRDPQLIDKLQVQNNVLLTFKYDLISSPDDEGPTTEEQLEEARDRIDTLETRIQEIERDDGSETSDESSDASGDEPNSSSE